MTNDETPNDEGITKFAARSSQLAGYNSGFVPGRFRPPLFGLLSSLVVSSSFKTGTYQRVAGVERSEPPESSDLGAHRPKLRYRKH